MAKKVIKKTTKKITKKSTKKKKPKVIKTKGKVCDFC